MIAVMMLLSIVSYAQVTTIFDGRTRFQSKNESVGLYSVDIYENQTRVTIEVIPTKNSSRLDFWTSRNTYIIVNDRIELPILGFLINTNGESVIDEAPFDGGWGWNNVKKGAKYYYTMVFAGKIPPGVTNFTLKDKGTSEGNHGYGFVIHKLNNPSTNSVTWTEASIKQFVDENNDGICGIYEEVGGNGYKLGCIKQGNEYKLLYLGGKERLSWWLIGDTKAILRNSATNGIFKAKWYMSDKMPNSDCYVVFDEGTMKTILNQEESLYLKMYPTSSTSGGLSSGTGKWSGTGFALNNGYIATNYHVVENAQSIKVLGIRGSYNTEYNAKVVSTDKNNDLAIIKINDSRFNGFGKIPYRIKTSTAQVGENVFVLGYPLTATMGDEIKLTTGVVSSKSGFQGDISLYQISAPVQPGNSGGPLFDGNGNLIGIVNAKHTGAENVSYAIKASYLKGLVESASSTSLLPTNNSVSGMTLSNKVKSLKNFVFMITCSNASNGGSTYNSSSVNYDNETSFPDRTYDYPLISSSYDKSLKLHSVAINSNETVLTLSCKNDYLGGWMNIDENAYIVANGCKYTLIRVEGITYSPGYTYFSYRGESKTFRLHFQAIPKNTTSIDFIENENSNWRMYGISLIQ